MKQDYQAMNYHHSSDLIATCHARLQEASRKVLPVSIAAIAVLPLLYGTVSAQKQGSMLRVYHRDSPASGVALKFMRAV